MNTLNALHGTDVPYFSTRRNFTLFNALLGYNLSYHAGKHGENGVKPVLLFDASFPISGRGGSIHAETRMLERTKSMDA